MFFGKAEGSCSLKLSGIHGTDARADDLRNICGRVDDQRHQNAECIAHLKHREQLGQAQPEEIQLQKYRSTAQDLDVYG